VDTPLSYRPAFHTAVAGIALGAAAGFALLAAVTAWARAAPFDCHAIANECYTQSFLAMSRRPTMSLPWRSGFGLVVPAVGLWLAVAAVVATGVAAAWSVTVPAQRESRPLGDHD